MNRQIQTLASQLGDLFGMRESWPWLSAAFASSILLSLHRIPGELDRGSILALTGLVLATVSVTFGIVAITTQHLAETYSREVFLSATGNRVWQACVVGEGVAVAFGVALALWRPDMTSGVVVAILLAASLLESWIAVSEQLRQFDPVPIIEALAAATVKQLPFDPAAAGVAIDRSLGILDITLIRAVKGDVHVVRAGLAAWNRILGAYLRSQTIVWNDRYLLWLYARCSELCETYAKESVGLVLPVIVEGISHLAQTTAAWRNPLNADVDEGTALLVDTLKKAAALSANARSTAADQATSGIGSIAKSCLEAEKFNVAQIPIADLTELGRTAAGVATEIASRAAMELSGILLRLAGSSSHDVMCVSDVEDAIKGIREIALSVPMRLGPVHFLTAPLADDNLPRAIQALALAAGRRDERDARPWQAVTLQAAYVAVEVIDNLDLNIGMRWYSVEAAACVVLGLLATHRWQPYIEPIRRIFTRLIDLAIEDDGRLHAIEPLDSVALALYEESRSSDGELRAILTRLAETIEATDQRTRARLAPILRRVGATALYYGDEELANVMAKASVPEPRSLSKQPRTLADAFVLRGVPLGLRTMTRPGLYLPPESTHFEDRASQEKFAASEARQNATS
ncbi:MAG: hypothetical protein ACREN2_02610 [Candidatus Dormibacteria bacterium]